MADDDAAASTGATTSIEEKTQGGENATSVSQKKPFDNGGWFTATYHNSRLIAVRETGAEALDKSASSQPKHKGNPLRKEKLPPLPKTDFKVIITPKDGLKISQLGTHQMARAITMACDAVVCSNCTEPVIEDGHTCKPRCALCKEAHPTRAKECKERLRRRRSPRPRTKERTAAGAQGADGRCRSRKRWFSWHLSSPSRFRSASKPRSWSRSASRTRQAPENKKKQQKKPVTRKEDEGIVSRKAPFFSASPTAPNNTNTQTVMVGKNGSEPPNDEVKDSRQTVQTLRAENAKLQQKLNDLIDKLKALRTGHTNANPR
ncbi:hypothetical protein HPB51_028769 [Rhipicephalus microplus]|uniref:Uncharacterized protein n=1 Tax=Rhipicephalus microplus TaxID=6941 RepID=A0A9J6CWK0_RHIMP|nr:hypothetical protein HPB51_028769 [Rhipicephalus microplus]